MQINLVFKDHLVENEFKNSQLRIHQKRLLILTAALLLQSSAIFFSNPLEINIFETRIILIFIIGMAVLVIGNLLIRKKFPRHSDKVITINVLLFIICAAEFVHRIQFKINLSSWVYFFLGINIQTGCCFLLISQIRWTHSLFVLSVIHVFSWFRVIDVAETTGALKAALISLTTHIIIFITLFYTYEKEIRRSFQKIRADNQQINSFDEIIKTVMSSAIIIMKDDDVLFTNEATKKILDIKSKDEVQDVLNTIEISSLSGSLNEPSISNMGKNIKTNQSLFWHYKNLENRVVIPNKKAYSSSEFKYLEGVINTIPDEKKSLSIQLGTTYWKGQESTIIIMNDISWIKNHFIILDAYKDNVLATVSHDLRTPLNGILGLLELLYDEIEDVSKKEKLEITITSAKLLLNMINDILDFSLISKGRLRLKFEKTNVKKLVEETASILTLQARLKGLSLEVENYLTGLEDYLVDGNRLRQVLLNLIGNAIKFTSEGLVKVRVYEENIQEHSKLEYNSSSPRIDEAIDEIKEDFNFCSMRKIPESQSLQIENKIISEHSSTVNLDRKRIIFEVEDTGIGIKTEDISKLFKLFSRVTTGHGKNMNGIGLGLAISQSLVTVMNSYRTGAKIQVKSNYGKGSNFSFPIYIDNEPSELFKEVDENSMRLPLYTETKPQNLNRLDSMSPNSFIESESDALNSGNKKKMIMAVDDDPINLLVASSYLKTLNDEYTLVTAANGKEALDKVNSFALKNEFFDIFLMDCNMPQMDGYEASRRLKMMMINKIISPAPIVAITANTATSDIDKCHDAGIDLFLTKPYSRTQLFKILEEAKAQINVLLHFK